MEEEGLRRGRAEERGQMTTETQPLPRPTEERQGNDPIRVAEELKIISSVLFDEGRDASVDVIEAAIALLRAPAPPVTTREADEWTEEDTGHTQPIYFVARALAQFDRHEAISKDVPEEGLDAVETAMSTWEPYAAVAIAALREIERTRASAPPTDISQQLDMQNAFNVWWSNHMLHSETITAADIYKSWVAACEYRRDSAVSSAIERCAKVVPEAYAKYWEVHKAHERRWQAWKAGGEAGEMPTINTGSIAEFIEAAIRSLLKSGGG
jgi:hypothetical protein